MKDFDFGASCFVNMVDTWASDLLCCADGDLVHIGDCMSKWVAVGPTKWISKRQTKLDGKVLYNLLGNDRRKDCPRDP